MVEVELVVDVVVEVVLVVFDVAFGGWPSVTLLVAHRVTFAVPVP